MATQSEELIFNIIQRGSSRVKFVRKHRFGGANFSSEPRNLTNLNTFKYSGVRNESVGLYRKNGKIYLQKSREKFQRNPNKKAASRTLATSKGFNKGVTQVVKHTSASFNRPELIEVAAKRFAKLYQAEQRKKTQEKTVIPTSQPTTEKKDEVIKVEK